MNNPLPEGLYDSLVTQLMSTAIADENVKTRSLSPSDYLPLIEHFSRELSSVLACLPKEDADESARQLSLELINGLLAEVRRRLTSKPGATHWLIEAAAAIELVASPPTILESVGVYRAGAVAPETGLSNPWLFTAAKDSPSLLNEIRRELVSANQVDILVSFITLSGVRKLRDVFESATSIGADGRPGTRVRVLTTTYTGATDLEAVDELARLPGCEVRVSLDGRRTRLHAKAWMFRRETGFGSAYVGSANLSGAALTGGLEWTVKLAQHGQSALFDRAIAHFETLWADREFERFNPDDPEHRKGLAAALSRERGGPAGNGEVDVLPFSFFELRPKAYQAEMLEHLSNERAHGRCRNLVVAATGTGKTIVAAFDYARQCREEGGRPRLLFVAHRREILRQALRAYREVLRAPEFGDLFTGTDNPGQVDHLFATIDSLSSRALVPTYGADYWHTVVIDECHRLAAGQFDNFVNQVKPKVLLGLTATPERSDGRPITGYFDQRPDGSPAVELRLWHALDLQLLSPFEYYACDDDTDFSQVPWRRVGEQAAVENLVTGNDIRARLVVREWKRLVGNIAKSKALVFCVSIAHANYMADYLQDNGIPVLCLTGQTEPALRRSAPERLARGEICAIVTVDLYNEGVDIPTVDTLLLLRPTQSPVLFQQQIGRGLRLSPGKEACVVLDFVGRHRTDFRFDILLSSLTGLSRRELVEGIGRGFGNLPPGCHLHLQKQARDQVLQGLRSLLDGTWKRLKTELQAYASVHANANVRLVNFLHDQALEVRDVFRSSTGNTVSGWMNLKAAAGLLRVDPDEEVAWFSKRFAALIHYDDASRIKTLEQLVHKQNTLVARDVASFENDSDAVLNRMIAYQLEHERSLVESNSDPLGRLSRRDEVVEELANLVDVLTCARLVPTVKVPGLEWTPLTLHAQYSRAEILTATGVWTAAARSFRNEGVIRLHDRKIELLFVTLDKSDGFHDRVAYKDYAISPECFHWQTQNSAAQHNAGGRRYLARGGDGWTFQLFVRQRIPEMFRPCGPIILKKIEGERPMSITASLVEPMPIELFRAFSVLRGV